MAATVWKGYLSFGLVSFPVRLYAAARAEAVHFHLLHKKDLSRVKEVWYCAKENKPIEREDMVRGYETSKGEYVVIEDDELKNVAPPTVTTMEVLQFVDADEVDPLYFEHSYYVAPEASVSKPYSLFLAALASAKKHALAKVAMHNREHVVLIRPAEGSLVLHTLFYEDELHAANRTKKTKPAYSAKELEMAKTLISHLTASFDSAKFEDTYRKNVERLIAEKKKGKKVTVIKQPKKAPVIDLMEALQRSLQSSRKKAS